MKNILSNKNNKYIVGFLVFLSISTLNITTFSSVWVPTSGWYLEWARNLELGRVAYLDFSYPFPPLLIEIHRLFLLTDDPLLISRIFDLLIFSSLAVGMYLVATKYLSIWLSALLSLLLSVFWELHPTNIVGGYFEFAVSLTIWSIYFYFRRKSGFDLFLAGILLSSASLVKQNFVFAVLVVFIVEFYRNWPKLVRRKGRELNFIYGVLLIYLLFLFYLLFNGSLLEFFASMTGGGGKSLSVDTLAINLLTPLHNGRMVAVVLLLLLSGYLIKVSTDIAIKTQISRLFYVFLVATSIMIALFYFSTFSIWEILGISLFLFVYSFSFFNSKSQDPNYKLQFYLFSVLAPLVVIVTWLISNSNNSILKNIWDRLVENNNQFLAAQSAFGEIVWLLILIVFLYRFFFWASHTKIGIRFFGKRNKDHLSSLFTDLADNQKKLAYKLPKDSLIIIALIISAIVNAFNGYASLEANLPLALLGLTWLFKHLPKQITTGISIALTTLLIIALPMITTISYNWIGWNEIKTKNVSNNIGVIQNFNLTKQQTDFYNELQESLQRAELETTWADNKSIAVFPGQPFLNNFSTYKPFDLRCPVSHIDICPEKDSLIDYKAILKGEPTIVVYYAFSDESRAALDNAFRNGKKSNINKIFDELKSISSKYELLDIISLEQFGDSNLYIFGLKNPIKT